MRAVLVCGPICYFVPEDVGKPLSIQGVHISERQIQTETGK